MFRGSFNPERLVSCLLVLLCLRRTLHGLGTYQYHRLSLYPYIQRFCSASFVGTCGGCCIERAGAMVYWLREHDIFTNTKAEGTTTGEGELLERRLANRRRRGEDHRGV
jgi:hypothetical protein